MDLKRIAAAAGCAVVLGCGWAPSAFAAVYPPDTTVPSPVITAVSPQEPIPTASPEIAPSGAAPAEQAGALPTTGSSSTGIGLQIGAGTVAVGLVGVALSRRRTA